MRLVFITTILCGLLMSCYVKAEIPYSQNLLLNAEHTRLERALTDQTYEIDKLRENYVEGRDALLEARRLVESMYVYALESLRLTNKKAFTEFVNILNKEELRNRFYYPVAIDTGFSGTTNKYVAWGDEKCVNPVARDKVHGTLLEIKISNFQHFNFDGDSFSLIRSIGPDEKKIATFKIKDGTEIYSLSKRLLETTKTVIRYYNCTEVIKFGNLILKYKEMHKRYLDLSMLLVKSPKTFTKQPTPAKKGDARP